MISSDFHIELQSTLVIDASVAINLNGTNSAEKIISALPYSLAITQNASDELAHGRRNGHIDSQLLEELIKREIVARVELGKQGLEIYEELIDGDASNTLDDGEAATIAYAIETGGVAVIDEKKARKICKNLFPRLTVLSTVDLLLDNFVCKALGRLEQADSIHRALIAARMRVPNEKLSAIVSIIGEARAAGCPSLPIYAKMIK